LGKDWQRAIGDFIVGWLFELGSAVVEVARKLKQHPQVSIWHYVAVTNLYINAQGPTTDYPHPYLWMWAFDFTYTVPPTGYLPEPGKKAIHMTKWEGEKYVKATYTNYKGQTRTRIGFLDEAMRRSFTETRFLNLGSGLGAIIAHRLAEDIAGNARHAGLNVRIA
jgi:hypothetical protein